MTTIHESAPNPQFVRNPWIDLTGTWRLRYDDDDLGLKAGWHQENFGSDAMDIKVPYPPESKLSGIGERGFHPIVWYQRELPAAPEGVAERTLIRFGAVDFEATVWISGVLVGHHIGGSSPFTTDVETAWLKSLDNPVITLRVKDDPAGDEQPRGKQSRKLDPDGIFYHRTTGVWQPVWMEFAPQAYVEYTRWIFNEADGNVAVDIELNEVPSRPIEIAAQIFAPDGNTVSATVSTDTRFATATIDLTSISDLDSLLWSTQSPTLLPTLVTTNSGDEVSGYIGLRTVALDRSGYKINSNPEWLRLVLSQGYFPESHYASPSAEAIRKEVELTLALGFNGARTHQKAEDPRYLYWADKLGLLIWGEIGAAYTWSDRSLELLSNEWRELVRRDINHPSIVTWVPFNESWGIWEVASNKYQQKGVRSVYELTKALDGTRPVIGNDGWEHVATDVYSLHDYNWEGSFLTERYGNDKSNEQINETYDVANKVAIAARIEAVNDLPLMVTEYGGVSFAPSEDEEWYGYGRVTTDEQFIAKYRELTEALQNSSDMVGICYTQLTDTEQETNGLLTENREPKIDIEVLAAITRGNK